jgi:hypothetical protein
MHSRVVCFEKMLKFLLLPFLLVNFANSQQFWSQCTHQPNIPTFHYIFAPRCTDRCRVNRGDTVNPEAKMFFRDTHQELIIRATAFILGIGDIL